MTSQALRAAAVGLLSTPLLLACAGAPPVPVGPVAHGDFSAVQRYASTLIAHAIDQDKIPGISIALVDDQRVLWSQGFGFADVAARRPASEDTIYRVGSISKLFTDVAALQLVESAGLGLDEPVQARLPGFSPSLWNSRDTPDITPRMLMTHHSGLQRDVVNAFQSGTPQRFSELTAHFDSYLSYPPGQVLSYSNIGLTVLGSLVERLSGTPFEQRVQRSVLDPLGMAHSAFDIAASPAAQMSKSYDGRSELPAVPLRDVPAGGLNSSVSDLSRFMKMLFADGQSNGHQLLKPETVAAMFQAQNAGVALDFDTQIGLGWFLQLPDKTSIPGGGLMAEHSGAIDGYRSHMAILPDHKLGVVVLSNSTTGTGPTQRIAEAVLKLALEAKTGVHPSASQARAGEQGHGESSFVRTPLAPDVIQQWVGNYTTPMGYVRIFSEDGRRLRVEALGHTVALRERDDGRMALSYMFMGIFPVDLGRLGSIGLSRRTVEGRELLVAHDGPREALAGERLHAAELNAETRHFVDRHLGRYALLDAGDGKVEIDSVQLLENHGLLIAEVTLAHEDQTLRVVLKPLCGRFAVALGPLADQGDIVEALPGEAGHIDVRALGVTLRKIGSAGRVAQTVGQTPMATDCGHGKAAL